MKLTQNQRVVMNMAVTYVRTFACIGMALFTSRWVLKALGQTDFGLYGVVGSVIGFIGYLRLVMSGSVVRFYAFAIGQSSREKNANEYESCSQVCSWFNIALFIHLSIAVLSAVVGYVIGIYAIEHWLTIPPDRMSACILVFRISIVGMFVSIVSVPFTSLFTAHQYITELVVFDLLTSVLVFCGSFMLMSASGDRLILYAILMTLSASGISAIQCIRARLVFRECRIRICYWFDWIRIRRLLSFAGWKIMGIGAWLLRSQGTAIVINIFHGPCYNASYSVATQLSVQSSVLSNALSNALNPAVTTIAGTGNHKKFVEYSLNACKFSAVLTSFATIPIICECENVLQLWLGTPPSGAATFCAWFAIAYLVESLSSGFKIALNANGKIARWQIAEAAIIGLPLLILWICYRLGMPCVVFGYLFAISYSVLVVERVIFAYKLLDISPKKWMRRVFAPVSFIMLFAFLVGFLITQILPASFLRLCITTIITLLLQCVLVWRFCLSDEEHSRIMKSMLPIVFKKLPFLRKVESEKGESL